MNRDLSWEFVSLAGERFVHQEIRVKPVLTPYRMPVRGNLTRRQVVATTAAVAGASGLSGGIVASARLGQATPGASPVADRPEAIIAIAAEAMEEMGLRAVLFHVIADGETVVSHALGEAMAGVPATTDDHFRNGAVAISYMSTVLLILVDQGVVTLDDTIDQWLPDLPDADRVTLRMLANMTSGYQDYVQNADLAESLYQDPFRIWTPEELVGFGLATPRAFEPGTNWAYSHTDYVILGLALEAATGTPLDALIQQHILDPLELRGTGASDTAWMPEPVLHAGSSERRSYFGIAPDVRFYEDSTYWSPSWTLARGAIEYTTIGDMARSFAAIGSGALVSDASYEEQTGRQLSGFGEPIEGCNNCFTQTDAYTYGLGIVHSNGWLLQNPNFYGYSGIAAWQPDTGVAIAVAATFTEEGFGEDGELLDRRASRGIFERIAAVMIPEGTGA